MPSMSGIPATVQTTSPQSQSKDQKAGFIIPQSNSILWTDFKSVRLVRYRKLR